MFELSQNRGLIDCECLALIVFCGKFSKIAKICTLEVLFISTVFLLVEKMLSERKVCASVKGV